MDHIKPPLLTPSPGRQKQDQGSESCSSHCSSGSITPRGMGHPPRQPWALLVPKEGDTKTGGDPLGRNCRKEPNPGAESLKRILEERLEGFRGCRHTEGHTQLQRDTWTQCWRFWSGCVGFPVDFSGPGKLEGCSESFFHAQSDPKLI